jgi:hypothetical protein
MTVTPGQPPPVNLERRLGLGVGTTGATTSAVLCTAPRPGAPVPYSRSSAVLELEALN